VESQTQTDISGGTCIFGWGYFTDTEIRKAKTKEVAYRMTDGRGLYAQVVWKSCDKAEIGHCSRLFHLVQEEQPGFLVKTLLDFLPAES
jgi:hypothetical protein